MGCDIHLFVERKIGNVWKMVSKHEKNFGVERNYALFGLLADVRNHNMPTIKAPQGLPEDLSKGIAKQWNKVREYNHTPSFYTLAELLAVKDNTYDRTCCLGIKDYKEFKKNGKLTHDPEWYFYQPKGAKLVTNDRMDRILNLTAFMDENEFFTTIEQTIPYKDISPAFWDTFVTRLQGMQKDPNNIRTVFWFDS